jgi:uncharacterized protein (DUF58 family)
MLITVGWAAGWPELTALGAGAISLLLAAAVISGPTGHADLILDASGLAVSRGRPAAARVRVTGARRRRSLRLTDGSITAPRRTLAVPPGDDAVVIDLPLDTSRRGAHPIGPLTLVRGDPWSMFRSVVASAPTGRLVVRPRTWPVRPDVLRSLQVGDEDMRTSRRGDDDFHALRAYVVGDEPRNVHWRSSARTGQLVVKQRVAAAAQGTLFVVDCDLTAYASAEAFGEGHDPDRFDAAVEVAASLVVARRRATPKVHLATTAAGTSTGPTTRTSATAQLDALAVVAAEPPAGCVPEQLPALVRRAECTRLVVVTGTPSGRLLAALAQVRQIGVAVTLVRTAHENRTPVAGFDVIDVHAAADLS